MKRIGLVLSVLLISFIIKFFSENLTGGAFFLKVGCFNGGREYSLFVEGGSKPPEPAPLKIAYSRPLIEPASSIPFIPKTLSQEEHPEDREFARAVDEIEKAHFKEITESAIRERKILEESIACLDFEIEEFNSAKIEVEMNFPLLRFEHALNEVPQFPEIQTPLFAEGDLVDISHIPPTDTELAAAETEVQNLALQESPFFAEYAKEFSPTLFAETELREEIAAYRELVVEPTQLAVRPYAAEPEADLIQLTEIPSTELELAAAETEVQNLALRESPFFAQYAKEFSPTPFAETELREEIAPYRELVVEPTELAVHPYAAEPEAELIHLTEIPSTELELAAAETEVQNLALQESLFFALYAKEFSPTPFAETELREEIAPYRELVVEPTELAVRPYAAEPEADLIHLTEIPSTELELAAAETEVQNLALQESPFFAEYAKEFSPTPFAETELREEVPSYRELVIEPTQLAVRPYAAEPEADLIHLTEIPSTELELAAAETDARKRELPIELALEQFEEPKWEGMAFGDAKLKEPLTPYAQVALPESKEEFLVKEVEFIPSEWGSFVEVPNTEKEFAAAETEARKRELPIELALEQFEEPKWEGMAFGDAKLKEPLTPYAQVALPESKEEFWVKEVEFIPSEWGSFVEVPNTEKEFAAAETDARKRELPIELALEQFEEPKWEGMAFGDAKLKESVTPYAQVALPESKEEFLVKEVEFIPSEWGSFVEVPNTEKEFAAAETDARKRERPIELALEQFEEPKWEGMAFGDAKLKEPLTPYAQVALPESKEEFLVKEVELIPSELGIFEEMPNTEQEFAAAETEVKKGELSVEQPPEKVEGLKEEEVRMAFGGTQIEEAIPEHVKLPNPKAPKERTELAQVPPDEEPPSWFKRWIESRPSSPVEEPSSESSRSSPWVKRMAIEHVWGDQQTDCLPFATNYTTLDLFLARDYRLGHMMPFGDFRGHRFDDNTYAANVGIGARYIPNPSFDTFCELLGFNVYYDYRQGSVGYYNQVGAGIEVLGSRWDFRANAYVPFGGKRHASRCLYNEYEGDYWAIFEQLETISYSFNGEIGCLLFETPQHFMLYAAGGPYFLAHALCDGGVVGGEVRLRPQYKDYVALDLSWRYDPLFESIWQIEVLFSLPLYQLANQNKRPCGISDRQIYQPVERFEVMPLSKRTCWYTNFN